VLVGEKDHKHASFYELKKTEAGCNMMGDAVEILNQLELDF
jgi:hypothetical protein